MKPKLMTVEIERRLSDEAYRRARKDHISERTQTKTLAYETGLAYGYVANIIASKRREYEKKLTFHVEQQGAGQMAGSRCEVDSGRAE